MKLSDAELRELLKDRDFCSPDEICEWMDNAQKAITELSGKAGQLEKQLAEVTAERDAAINDLKAGAWCENCAHYADMAECGELPMCYVCRVECYCKDCNDGNKWAWRGLKEE